MLRLFKICYVLIIIKCGFVYYNQGIIIVLNADGFSITFFYAHSKKEKENRSPIKISVN